MKSVLVLGAGKIGRMVVHLLQRSGDWVVTVADAQPAAATACSDQEPGSTGVSFAFDDCHALDRALRGQWAVVSCAPFHCNPLIAERARAAHVHYLDLTEDVAVTKAVKSLAEGASTAFAPQCGLAPGFVTIAATALAAGLNPVTELRLRVGALPRYPNNALKYNLTWSTAGLINEYCNPCEALHDGAPVLLPPLENLEHLTVDGVEYEAFNTSGGLGSLVESLAGKVQRVNYKTIRYPGHAALMKFLLHDLAFRDHREELERVFERAIPATNQDQCIVFVSAIGMEKGKLVKRTDARTITDREMNGRHWTAIQVTTAAGICAVLDLMANGKVAQHGFVRMEDVRLSDFLANRFGRLYA